MLNKYNFLEGYIITKFKNFNKHLKYTINSSFLDDIKINDFVIYKTAWWLLVPKDFDIINFIKQKKIKWLKNIQKELKQENIESYFAFKEIIFDYDWILWKKDNNNKWYKYLSFEDLLLFLYDFAKVYKLKPKKLIITKYYNFPYCKFDNYNFQFSFDIGLVWMPEIEKLLKQSKFFDNSLKSPTQLHIYRVWKKTTRKFNILSSISHTIKVIEIDFNKKVNIPNIFSKKIQKIIKDFKILKKEKKYFRLSKHIEIKPNTYKFILKAFKNYKIYPVLENIETKKKEILSELITKLWIINLPNTKANEIFKEQFFKNFRNSNFTILKRKLFKNIYNYTKVVKNKNLFKNIFKSSVKKYLNEKLILKDNIQNLNNIYNEISNINEKNIYNYWIELYEFMYWKKTNNKYNKLTRKIKKNLNKNNYLIINFKILDFNNLVYNYLNKKQIKQKTNNFRQIINILNIIKTKISTKQIIDITENKIKQHKIKEIQDLISFFEKQKKQLSFKNEKFLKAFSIILWYYTKKNKLKKWFYQIQKIINLSLNDNRQIEKKNYQQKLWLKKIINNLNSNFKYSIWNRYKSIIWLCSYLNYLYEEKNFSEDQILYIFNNFADYIDDYDNEHKGHFSKYIVRYINDWFG